MMLRKWEDLPQEMRTEEVRPYYDLLRKKQGSLLCKRLFDILASLVLLVLLSPVFLVLAIAIAGMLGPNLVNAVIAISAVSWTKYARLARSLVLKIKSELYMEAAVVTGTRTLGILKRYVVPNMITTLIVTAATDIGTIFPGVWSHGAHA